MAVDDFNGDGKPDLATANLSFNNVSVLLGNGAGSFGAATNFGAGAQPFSVAVGDFNGDGKPDLATANLSFNNDVSVLLNTCTANQPPTITPVGVTREAGSPGSSATIATVNDTEDAENTLSVTATPLTGSGVTLSSISVSASGNVTATVQAACSATSSTFTLRVTDSGALFAEATLTVTVNPDATPPVITLIGANPLTVECAIGFTDPGATALDKCSGARTVTATNNINGNVPGSYAITYSASDGNGNTATSKRTVKVVDTTAPLLTLKANIALWPPNHNYQTVTMAQMVASVMDGCNSTLGIANVVIEKVTSDEPDDVAGNADGITTNDIVIAGDCKSVQLRAERNETLNGRVYVITLRVRDASGNTTRKDFKVSVPISQNGAAAVQGATAQTKTSGCP